jgi:S1-C subfamily serine protease
MPTKNEDVLQKLAPSIVEIISDKEQEDGSCTLGAGIFVSDDGLIVTCRHVVTDSGSKFFSPVKCNFIPIAREL